MGNKKWEARIMGCQNVYYGGLFDNEKQAAMKVNLLCDKNGIDRKNPLIDIKIDKIQQVPNQTSKYNGVSWDKDKKKWRTQFMYNKKTYYGGYFDNEEQAAMEVNLLCDKNGMERKNPMIDQETNVIQQVNKGKKRKRKEVPALNDDVEEKVKITTPNHDAN